MNIFGCSLTWLLTLLVLLIGNQQFVGAQPAAKTAPTQYKEFEKLTAKEKAAFYRVYREDKVANKMLGGAGGWILGEAPREQPESLAHFPVRGRFDVEGVITWQSGNQCVFESEIRKYIIKERYLLYRLKKLGVKKRKPVRVRLDAYWVYSKETSDYRLLYFNAIHFQDGRPGFANQQNIVREGSAVPYPETAARPNGRTLKGSTLLRK